MTAPDTPRQPQEVDTAQLKRKVTARAARDPEFRERLKSSPKDALFEVAFGPGGDPKSVAKRAVAEHAAAAAAPPAIPTPPDTAQLKRKVTARAARDPEFRERLKSSPQDARFAVAFGPGGGPKPGGGLRRDVEARAASDPAFRQRLQDSPGEAVYEAFGVRIPDPSEPVELEDAELEAAAGGDGDDPIW